jgi:hypothetical protein
MGKNYRGFTEAEGKMGKSKVKNQSNPKKNSSKFRQKTKI